MVRKEEESSDKKRRKWQDPLKLRVIECPSCEREHLIDVVNLSRNVRCVCNKKFHAAEHLITHQQFTMEDCYSTWSCPKCRKSLFVPQLSVALPARCPCGHGYPAEAEKESYNVLDEITEAFVGNDPHFSENMLVSLRAAQRYDYEVTQESEGVYSIRNPKKGTVYTVELTSDFMDECNCSVFQVDAGTCIHVEHVRLKLGLPSTAQALADASEFAYAWLDKTSLPSRIRVGWMGDIEHKVRAVLEAHRTITKASDLEDLHKSFDKIGISFKSLLSAKLAFACDTAIETNTALAEQIALEGRKYLNQNIPELHQFQVEGSLFLANAQRALLLDEMGLGKTVQAIAAACLLRQFADIQSCLIIAPKSVLEHWKSESYRFTKEECTIIQGSAGARADLYLSDSFFKVVTLDSFRRDFPEVGNHDLIVVDEVHKARNIRTLSNRVLREFKSRFFFGLSGTAIESSLEDLYGLLRIVRSPDLESPLEFYASHILCNDFGKTTDIFHPEFFYIRHADRILRRCKSETETETEIPDIHIEHIDLPLSNLQEEMAEPILIELDELKERLKQRYELNDFIRKRLLVNRIVELSNSTEFLDDKTSSSSKLEWLAQFLKSQCVETNEKVVIFTRWIRSQKMILRLCNTLGITHTSLNGEHSSVERKKAVRSFTDNDDLLVFVSTDAGGVGINLQAARTIVNFEPGWNPSTDAQRIQRVHRIGQLREVRAYLPVTILDDLFTLITHPRKSFAADRIDAARQLSSRESMQTWEELLPVIKLLRKKAEKQTK